MSVTVAHAPERDAHAQRRHVRLVIGTLLLGMLLASLSQTIVSTALPTIVGDLGGLDHLSWVVTAYLLAMTASTPLWGKLGDLYGRKRFFEAAIVLFLVGSALSGVSQSMGTLIAFRAVQGLGGGGLIVTSQALVGDVVAPRDRGKYQGLFGAVFGVSSVLGPLLGGFLVEHLSWRWCFYVTVPVGAGGLLASALFLPKAAEHVERSIDYLGTVLLGGAATLLILFTSLGGTTYAWNSAPEIAFVLGALALLVAFAFVERRAAEPVLPLHLFANRVFLTASAIGFVVGFAMFGAITFLPLFLQVVQGVDPTASGFRLIPMMGGLLLTSIGTGQLISRFGRYKVYPVAGTAIMALGLWLLSLMDETTSTWLTSVYMFVFGFGIGAVMQVLVIAVQNAVPFEELGTATSGAMFFRSIGGSFGVAVFGAIFANQLTGNLMSALGGRALPPGVGEGGADPAALERLPAPIHAAFVHGYAESLGTVFLVAVPIAAAAFLLTWLLPEVPLRATTRAVDPGETFGMPTERTSLQEVERALAVLVSGEERREMYGRLAARAGLSLEPRACWLLYRLVRHPCPDVETLAERLGADVARVAPAAEALAAGGYVASPGGNGAGGGLALTPRGAEAAARLVEARRAGLSELLAGWSPEEHPELQARLRELAQELLAEDDEMLREAGFSEQPA